MRVICNGLMTYVYVRGKPTLTMISTVKRDHYSLAP